MATPVVVEVGLELGSELPLVWDALTDTDRVNRLMGMNALTTERIRGPGAARYRIHTRAGGWKIAYDEEPFEWVRHQRFTVRRRMLVGPVVRVDSGFHFAAGETGGTRVTLRLELEPRARLWAPVVRLGARREMASMERAVRSIDAQLRKVEAPPPPVGLRASALAEALGTLGRKHPPALVERLGQLVQTGRDDQLQRLRPYELAEAWGLDRAAVLAACLDGVRAGLLELRWEVICPSCRTAAERVPTLAALSTHGECHLCELEFGLELDESVEATFLPARAVRPVDTGRYCIGGPANTPHVVAQALLPPRGEAVLLSPPEPGRYRLFVRGGEPRPVELTADAPAELETDDAGGARLQLKAGGRLRVRSTSDEGRHVKLERAQFPALAATARDVTAVPGFRRDFSAEVLRRDLSLRVSRVALFFSDLTGSTQLYSDVGDAPALKLVQDHFDVVVGALEQHGGTLVKTIGDAVMAAFADELTGLSASLAVLSAYEAFRTAEAARRHVHIKLGLYAGPSYLVTANGVLDYFGQTVNIAARLQAQAQAGELVVEAALADRAIAAGRLDARAVTAREAAQLKGVDQPIAIARLRPAPSPAA